MLWATGFYDEYGLPRVSIHIGGGPHGAMPGSQGLEFDAVINTSFT